MEKNIVPFLYGQHEIRTMSDQNGDPWFVAKDVCDVLGIENSRDAVGRVEEDEKNTVRLIDGNRGNPNTTIINESGLYNLIFRSDKPEARAFRRWVTHEVLPALRKTGTYTVPAGKLLISKFDVTSWQIVQFCRDWIRQTTGPFTTQDVVDAIEDQGIPCGHSHAQQAIRIERIDGVIDVPRKIRKGQNSPPPYIRGQSYRTFLGLE